MEMRIPPLTKRTPVAMTGTFSALCVCHHSKSTHLISAIFAATSKMDIIEVAANIEELAQDHPGFRW